jgi:hypothetical protein
MSDRTPYEQKEIKAASAAIAKGHRDPSNLRELLIWTTSKTTWGMIDSYFRQHHHDKELLAALISIALEGEDAGDAPWAAANTIADFPASMLVEHKDALLELSRDDWSYLKLPALKALAKIESNAT